jgi:hypothetical protein
LLQTRVSGDGRLLPTARSGTIPTSISEHFPDRYGHRLRVLRDGSW